MKINQLKNKIKTKNNLYYSFNMFFSFCAIILLSVFNTAHSAEMSKTSMLANVMPSVVNISIQSESNSSPYFNQFGPNNNRQQNQSDAPSDNDSNKYQTIGSGVIVDAKNNYILTNAHLMKTAKKITVSFEKNNTLTAKLIGSDDATDIAVLQVNASNLKPIKLGDSSELQIGETVYAIGNPFGLNQTVTSGIISGLNRNDLRIENYENFIQTDASINPGNSGGALVNSKGELIGINTAILSSATNSAGNIGIGFAIPINMAKDVMNQLIKYGSMKRGLIGIALQDLTPDLAEAIGVNAKNGAIVTEIYPNTPAQKAGLKIADIIKEVDGKEIISASQMRNIIGLIRAKDSVNLKILRPNNKNTTASNLEKMQNKLKDPYIYLSLSLISNEDYTSDLNKSNKFLYGMNLESFYQSTTNQGIISGVAVKEIDENSLAYSNGIRKNDVITYANMEKINSLNELRKILNDNSKNISKLLLTIVRLNGTSAFVVLDPK